MARHHDKPGVFDVSKPHKTHPSATSRPVIVGHHLQVSDPMVKADGDKYDPAAKTIPVSVHEPDEEGPHSMITEPPHMGGGSSSHDDDQAGSEDRFDRDHERELMAHAQVRKDIEPVNPDVKPSDDEKPPESSKPSEFIPVDTRLDDKKPEPAFSSSFAAGSHAAVPGAVMTQPLHITKSNGASGLARKTIKWTLIGVLTIAVTAFLAIDTGLVQSDVSLPFHIFNKQKKNQTTTISPSPPPVIITPTPKPDTSNYSITGAGISFSYPTAWGTPTTTAELGFATRGGGAKPTGNYAYLINFDKNKNIQIAITSSKYLPPVRTPLYYDFLQWCTGTNDNKIYRSVLLFTTAGGVDTPTTVVCNNGPLPDAAKTKSDPNTVIQLNTKDADGKTVLGDVYTKNLTSITLPVIRVKDSAMTNGDAVKKLLSSVKVAPSSAAPATQ